MQSVKMLSINVIIQVCSVISVLHGLHIRDVSTSNEDQYEIVYLPLLIPREAYSRAEINSEEAFSLAFEAFGQQMQLNLKRNDRLISPHFKAYIHDEGSNEPRLLEASKNYRNCLYSYQDGSNVAAISACSPKPTMQGILVFNNKTMEILPLEDEQPHDDGKYAHIIREVNADSTIMDSSLERQFERTFHRVAKRSRNRPVDGYTLELALFFDAAAYRTFSPFLHHDDEKLQDMILAYLNGVQALYHHPSLGTNLEIVLVRLDIMKHQPADLPHYEGERGALLDSFCMYQHRINAASDEEPTHWDMGVYISGLDFFAYENGRKSAVTMGLATVAGVCLSQYACVIAEFGTTNIFGKPYPSAGFTSVYILAHEIGHNLGMHHDSSGNRCTKDGFIMSPSRGTNGETQWSACSAEVMADLRWTKCLHDGGVPKAELDHKQFSDTPGQIYTAKKQCEILLTDLDAVMAPTQQLSTICHNLQCKTPHRSGYYHSGPALEGTECGQSQYCFGGDCVSKELSKPVDVLTGGWGAWKLGPCTSGCTLKSLGYQEKRRMCNNPTPVNADAGCEGSSFGIGLCKDDRICSRQSRLPTNEFASLKCRDFAKVLPQLDSHGVGLQAPHESDRLWMGCAVFCRRAEGGGYYTPRIELNDLGISPYFPDGTWCHADAAHNYYCQQHHCLPEHFQFTKWFLNHLDQDIPIPQNARLNYTLPQDLQQYLSLDENGRPLKTEIPLGMLDMKDFDNWESDDYRELPQSATQRKAYY